MDESGHRDELAKALADPMWDDPFWLAFEGAEEKAKAALMDLYDEAYEGFGCACDTCMVRTIMESVWPTLTDQFHRLLALRTPVQTMGAPGGGGCGGNCACRRKE